MLLMIVAICFCPTKVFATSTIERTTTLDVSKFIQDEENKEEGWSWNSTTNTLTLTNVNFNTGDNMSIVLPSDRDIHIVSNGNNKLITGLITRIPLQLTRHLIPPLSIWRSVLLCFEFVFRFMDF